MIRGLWDWQADSIIDIKLGDADTDYYKYEPMAELLVWLEKIKKDKYGDQASFDADNCVPYLEGGATSIAVALLIKGVTL